MTFSKLKVVAENQKYIDRLDRIERNKYDWKWIVILILVLMSVYLVGKFYDYTKIERVEIENILIMPNDIMEDLDYNLFDDR